MSGCPSRVIKVSLAEELVVFLEIQAEAEGLHPADLVNRAVAEYLSLLKKPVFDRLVSL